MSLPSSILPKRDVEQIVTIEPVGAAGTRETRPHNTVAARIGIAILAGDYRPDDTLPNEDEASAALNVSRSAYREAIRTLAAKGLVHSRPKVGTRVSVVARWNLLDVDVLTWLFAREPDERLLRDLFSIRQMVEPPAARLAAKNWTEETFAVLRDAMDGLIANEPSSEPWQQADKQFHETIILLADNAFLMTLANAITTAVRLTTQYKLREPGIVNNSTVDHLRVYEAIAARDGDRAADCVERLIKAARDLTFKTSRNARKGNLRPPK